MPNRAASSGTAVTAPSTPGWLQASGTWCADNAAAEVAALSASASRPTAAPVSAAAMSLADTMRSRFGSAEEGGDRGAVPELPGRQHDPAQQHRAVDDLPARAAQQAGQRGR
jgi:hypothetical protein